MILVVPPRHVPRVEAELKRRHENFYVIGRIENSHRVTARVACGGKLPLYALLLDQAPEARLYLARHGAKRNAGNRIETKNESRRDD
jgi:phosphoribosylformylglycinamidine (FGAM) synthase-like enzyme